MHLDEASSITFTASSLSSSCYYSPLCPFSPLFHLDILRLTIRSSTQQHQIKLLHFVPSLEYERRKVKMKRFLIYDQPSKVLCICILYKFSSSLHKSKLCGAYLCISINVREKRKQSLFTTRGRFIHASRESFFLCGNPNKTMQQFSRNVKKDIA